MRTGTSGQSLRSWTNKGRQRTIANSNNRISVGVARHILFGPFCNPIFVCPEQRPEQEQMIFATKFLLWRTGST